MQRWSDSNPTIPIVGQIFDPYVSSTRFETFPTLDSKRFYQFFKDADVIVSHAGMGNIISALELDKPIIVVPRISRLGEHRNDHQVDTAKRFERYSGVFVATDYDEFSRSLASARSFVSSQNLSPSADKVALFQTIHQFLRM
jgi:UDP-N-acetylglucosamine transferase subunit ALG13